MRISLWRETQGARVILQGKYKTAKGEKARNVMVPERNEYGCTLKWKIPRSLFKYSKLKSRNAIQEQTVMAIYLKLHSILAWVETNSCKSIQPIVPFNISII